MRSAPARSPARRLFFLAVPYVIFALALLGVETAVRLTRPHVSRLDFFVTAPEQQAQLADARRLRIFEGDPLLCWRLAPGLRDVVWDQTRVTTNAGGLRYDHDVGLRAPGAFRILCVGDSVTFGFRVPLVFLKRPQDSNPAWRPYPGRMEAALRAANPFRWRCPATARTRAGRGWSATSSPTRPTWWSSSSAGTTSHCARGPTRMPCPPAPSRCWRATSSRAARPWCTPGACCTRRGRARPRPTAEPWPAWTASGSSRITCAWRRWRARAAPGWPSWAPSSAMPRNIPRRPSACTPTATRCGAPCSRTASRTWRCRS